MLKSLVEDNIAQRRWQAIQTQITILCVYRPILRGRIIYTIFHPYVNEAVRPRKCPLRKR